MALEHPRYQTIDSTPESLVHLADELVFARQSSSNCGMNPDTLKYRSNMVIDRQFAPIASGALDPRFQIFPSKIDHEQSVFSQASGLDR